MAVRRDDEVLLWSLTVATRLGWSIGCFIAKSYGIRKDFDGGVL